MPKKSDEPLEKHTMHLYEGDFERLKDLHPDIGVGIVIRKLVRKHLKENEPKVDTSKFHVKV